MKVQENIFSQQVDLLFKLLLLPIVAIIINSSIIVYVLREHYFYNELLWWLSFNIIVAIFRFLLYLKYKNNKKIKTLSDESLYRLFFIGNITSALLWAYLIVFLFPSDNFAYQLFIAFIWAGMASGGVSSLSARFEIFVTYSTVILIPLAIRFFSIQGDVSLFMGITTFLFWIILISSSWRLYKTTKESFELAYDNSELLEEVETLNKKLKEKLDISENELKHQEAILFQQSKLASMGEMIGNIAHQWRQPLNALALNIQDIEDAYEFGELDKPYIDNMTKKSMSQINYMSKTIDDFRNFVNPHQKTETIDIAQAVQDTLNLLFQSLEKHHIQLIFDKPSYIAKVVGNGSEFKQVIVNIINNAKDAILEKHITKPKIVISMSVDEQKVNLNIGDNASGIPSNVISRIFEPYFTTKEEGKGTGIGLYMSHMIIVDKMGGKLEVSNTPEGALFTMILPLKKDN